MLRGKYILRCPTAPTQSPGFLGHSPKLIFGDFCSEKKVTRARGRETPPYKSFSLLRGPP